MKAPETVETARLVLRRPQPSDAAAVFERYAGDAEVTRYLGWPRHRSVADTEAFIAFSDAEWARAPAGPYLIWHEEQLIGGTGLAFATPYRAQTGYVLARDAWGRGFATEALAAMVELAPSIGVRRLEALCHPDHAASWHVLEKCGFVYEALLARHTVLPNLVPDWPLDLLMYARVR
jgi:RimJ/RimL family protein N-acetyltransferase